MVPTGSASSTASPPRSRRARTPRHDMAPDRNQVLQKMLDGLLEDDQLTVADVLGALESELRSGPGRGPPLAEQYERYIGPLTEVAGPPAGAKRGGGTWQPAPLPSATPLLGPAPAGLHGGWQAPALPQRRFSASEALGASAPRGHRHSHVEESGEKVVFANCARCAVLEQQVRALAQSFAGLCSRIFNWSLSHCKGNTESKGLWFLLLKYAEPVNAVDNRIADVCANLQAACGTVAPPRPARSATPTRGTRSGGTAQTAPLPAPHAGDFEGGKVWHPPAVPAMEDLPPEDYSLEGLSFGGPDRSATSSSFDRTFATNYPDSRRAAAGPRAPAAEPAPSAPASRAATDQLEVKTVPKRKAKAKTPPKREGRDDSGRPGPTSARGAPRGDSWAEGSRDGY